MIPREQPRMSLTTIGVLLSDFDGIPNDFDTSGGEAAKIYKGDLSVGRRLRQNSDWHEAEKESVRMVPLKTGVRKLAVRDHLREA